MAERDGLRRNYEKQVHEARYQPEAGALVLEFFHPFTDLLSVLRCYVHSRLSASLSQVPQIVPTQHNVPAQLGLAFLPRRVRASAITAAAFLAVVSLLPTRRAQDNRMHQPELLLEEHKTIACLSTHRSSFFHFIHFLYIFIQRTHRSSFSPSLPACWSPAGVPPRAVRDRAGGLASGDRGARTC
eukprot:357450-Chlamydomonas_euryale.AAC.2